jgi:hypothetical protein
VNRSPGRGASGPGRVTGHRRRGGGDVDRRNRPVRRPLRGMAGPGQPDSSGAGSWVLSIEARQARSGSSAHALIRRPGCPLRRPAASLGDRAGACRFRRHGDSRSGTPVQTPAPAPGGRTRCGIGVRRPVSGAAAPANALRHRPPPRGGAVAAGNRARNRDAGGCGATGRPNAVFDPVEPQRAFPASPGNRPPEPAPAAAGPL